MARIVASHALLAWVLVMVPWEGTRATGPSQVEAAAKHIKGVPIYNYWAALSAKSNGIRGRGDVTRWFVQARQDSEEQMRDFCAVTALGSKHCHYVAENMPAFFFKGSEEELAIFLDLHGDIVELVEPELEVNIADDMVPLLRGEEQSDPQWHLDRIDQYRGLSDNYAPGIHGGAKGAHVFVLDTGIRTTHRDFEGRAVPTFDTTSGSMVVCDPKDVSCAADTHGHGTHCAGVVGGKAFGVAKDVTLHACKVLDPEGYTLDIVMGIDWVISHGEKPAVLSMSLGGEGRSRAYQAAVNASFNAGVTVVVAAGNEDSDACDFSPSYVPSAITVGATRSPFRDLDQVSWFSNYGTCVDIFAPGSDIESCGHRSDTSFAVMSGTSMACPAVAGAAALLLVAQPGIHPGEVACQLKTQATRINIVGEHGRAKPHSPGLLLYVGKDWDPNATCSDDYGEPSESFGMAWVAWVVAPIGLVLVAGYIVFTLRKCCYPGVKMPVRAQEPLLTAA